jgi:hypothetical protein
MSKSFQSTVLHPVGSWHMPINLESYNRSPLTEEERWALEQSVVPGLRGSSTTSVTVRKILTRFEQPIADVFHLRHQGKGVNQIYAVHRFMRFQMHRYAHGLRNEITDIRNRSSERANRARSDDRFPFLSEDERSSHSASVIHPLPMK